MGLEKMTQLGYTEGINMNYDLQNPKGDRNLTKKLAQDLVAKKLDLYVSFSTTSTKAMQAAQTGTGAKIVFGDVGNHMELGLESLRNTGKNITGVTAANVLTTTDATISGQAEKITEYLRQEKIPSMDCNLEEGVLGGYLMSHASSRKEMGIELPQGLLQQATLIKK